jgi:inhibitor of cysteine peptidase
MNYGFILNGLTVNGFFSRFAPSRMTSLDSLEYTVMMQLRRLKLKRISVFILTAIMVLALSGCQGGSGGTSTNTSGYEIKPAPIHELKIAFAESYPVQVFLYIKGGLADGATTFNEVVVGGLKDHTIAVTVTTKRPKDAIATQVYGYFEQNVNLGSNFKSGDTYTVKVNDKNIDFTMP